MKQFKHPATIIATLSLFLTIGGGAYAAATGMISGSQIKNYSIPVRKLTLGADKTLESSLGNGQTLRGVFLAEGEATGLDSAQIGDSISFHWNFGPLTAHFIKAGDPLPPGCFGNANHPGAAPNNLCVFEKENANIDDSKSTVWNPAANSTSSVARFGAGVSTMPAGPGPYEFGGSWAVTAPLFVS